MRTFHQLIGLSFVAFAPTVAAQGVPWSQLSLSTCRVDEFLRARPNSDGRGVVIAVLDTGVDMSVPGLRETPDGRTKVVDVQDFSGQGDHDLIRIHLNDAGKLLYNTDDGTPVEYNPPPTPDAITDPVYWFTRIREKRFLNSAVPDLNDNGEKNDEFGALVLVGRDGGDDDALVYIDTDLDHDFADERPLANYRLRHDTFTFARTESIRQTEPLAFALNVFLNRRQLVLHFDDGGHGTHVAGIAAGYHIQGDPAFNGVAPGANVISLKIGENSLGGVTTSGAKRRAFEYAARYAREHNVPVVCNLSYGINSVHEGQSDVDRAVEDLLRANPYLVICHSAGNDGPGISTIGTPAAASSITVGALMAADTARDVTGGTIPDAVVTVFSSRGAELPKPTIVAPGMSTSTVPRHVTRGDFWSGTSMASPYAAGTCALLISDVLARDPAARVRAVDLQRALCQSARTLPGITPLDQGWGVINVPAAADRLAALMQRAAADPLIGYDISTPCPTGPEGKAPAAYWRSTWFPTADGQTFSVKPVFSPEADGTQRLEFSRRFALRSTAPWLKLTQEQVYLHREAAANVRVEYDPAQLAAPGLYVGTVEALWEDRVEFRLLNTIVVPHRFDSASDFTRKFTGLATDGWLTQRHFLAVPPAASAMNLTLLAPEGARSTANASRLFNPVGKRFRRGDMSLNTDQGKRRAEWDIVDDLRPGVWEWTVYGDRVDDRSPYELEVRFFGLRADPAKITSWKHKSGAQPSGSLTVTNLFDRVAPASAEALVEGYRRKHDEKFKGAADTVEIDIKLDATLRAARIAVELSDADFAKTTDVGVQVLDSSGKALTQTGMDDPRIELTVNNPQPDADAVSLKLKINAAFTHREDDHKTPITIHVDHLYKSPPAIDVTADTGDLAFVPGIAAALSFKVQQAPPALPDGTHSIGYLCFRDRHSKALMLSVPLEIKEKD